MKIKPYIYNQELYDRCALTLQYNDYYSNLANLANGKVTIVQLQELYQRDNQHSLAELSTLNAELIHLIDSYGTDYRVGKQTFAVLISTFAIHSEHQVTFERYITSCVVANDINIIGHYVKVATGYDYLQI